MQYLRNVKLSAVNSKALLELPMTLLTADAKVEGNIEDTGGDVLIIDHTTDNTLMSFRFRFPTVRMLAAEDDFERPGTPITQELSSFPSPIAPISSLPFMNWVFPPASCRTCPP